MYFYGTRDNRVDVTDLIDAKTPDEIFRIESKTFDVNSTTDCYLSRRNHYYLDGISISQKMLENAPCGDFEEGEKLVTVVIPSLARPTLKQTIDSLRSCESARWDAIVVYDGVPDTKIANVNTISIAKIGFKNCAGAIRNFAMGLVRTPWICFLDDDDTYTLDYFYRLQQEIRSHPKADVIVFRMINHDGKILPSRPTLSGIGGVGISFAMKTTLYSKSGMKFKPSPIEDFLLLEEISAKGFRIHVSDYITYIVGSK